MVDVYDMASAIGVQFEKLIANHGQESVTGLMPLVIRSLEHLEDLAKQNELEQAEIGDLKFTIERLQTEKKLKAEEHNKFQKVLVVCVRLGNTKIWNMDHLIWKTKTTSIWKVLNRMYSVF